MKNKICIILVVCFLCMAPNGICACTQAKDVPVLLVKDDAGRILGNWPMPEGRRFAISFIHSVAQSPVTDFYFIKNNVIHLDSTEYHDFGAGLPHCPEDGQTMTTEDGRIIIANYNRQIPEFAVRVGRTARHRLLILEKDQETGKERVIEDIPLSQIADPGHAVIFGTAAR